MSRARPQKSRWTMRDSNERNAATSRMGRQMILPTVLMISRRWTGAERVKTWCRNRLWLKSWWYLFGKNCGVERRAGKGVNNKPGPERSGGVQLAELTKQGKLKRVCTQSKTDDDKVEQQQYIIMKVGDVVEKEETGGLG